MSKIRPQGLSPSVATATFAPIAGREFVAAPLSRVLARTAPAATVSLMQSGHGFGFGGDYDAGLSNVNDTSTYLLGSQSVKMVTNGTTTVATLGKGSATPVSFTGRNVRLILRLSNLAGLDYLELYAGTGGFTNMFTWGGSGKGFYTQETDPSINYSKDGEWAYIDLSFADATTVGTPNRASIDTWQVRLRGKASLGAVTLYVQGIQAVPTSAVYPNGVVSLTFDDSQVSAYTLGKPILDKYAYTGTWYTICDRVGTGGDYMTQAQLDTLYAQGHDIAAHAYYLASHNLTNGFNDLSADALDEEFLLMKEWLRSRGYHRGADHFCWPQGKFTPATVAAASKFFASIRSGAARNTLETLRPSDPLRLRDRLIPGSSYGLTAAQITDAITRAYNNGAWLNLTIHKVVASSPTGADVTTAELTTIVDHLATTGIPVRTVHEVINSL